MLQLGRPRARRDRRLPPRETALSLLVTLAIVVSSGCNIAGAAGAATPEDAVRGDISERARREGAQLRNLQILKTQALPDSAVVLYSYHTSGGRTGASDQFGYQLVSRDVTGWHPKSSSTEGGNTAVPPGALVCYGISIGYDSGGKHSLVYGRAAQPDVATIEVDFSSGVTLTDTNASGVFLVWVPDDANATQLRLLDSNNKVAHQAKLPPLTAGGGQAGGASLSSTCEP